MSDDAPFTPFAPAPDDDGDELVELDPFDTLVERRLQRLEVQSRWLAIAVGIEALALIVVALAAAG